MIHREKNRKFALFESIGAVVEHLRAVAGRQATGDAMKAGAALKDAQRRLVEVKLAKLEGQLLSMPEIEALWGDMAAATKWLFLALPVRMRMEFGIDAELEGRVQVLCTTMLRQVAFQGQMQLPTGNRLDDDDDDDDRRRVRRRRTTINFLTRRSPFVPASSGGSRRACSQVQRPCRLVCPR